MDMALGARAALWCPECATVVMAKVVEMTPGYTKITSALCLDCDREFEPGAVHVPDQGKHDVDDEDHTPREDGSP